MMIRLATRCGTLTIVVVYCLAWLVTCQHKGNVYTSIAHMEPLIDIEARLVEIASEYLNKERRKLGELKQFAKSVEEAMTLSKDEPLKYLGNPVNSYLIIKRFTSGWKELASRLQIDDSRIEEINSLLSANEHHLPTYKTDLLGATASIFRLQDTYEITAREISDGKIKDVSKSAHQMTAEDCINIANYAHLAKRYVRMQEWSKEAERIMDDASLSDRIGNATRLSVYELIGWTAYLSNNLEEASKYAKLVLEIDPKNEAAIKNEEFYQFYKIENIENWLTEEQWDFAEAQKDLTNFQIGTFVELCQMRKTPVKVKDTSKLVCYYKKEEPVFRLKPMRVTRVHDNPEILIFHNVLNNEEIQTLKKLATPYLQQAQVVDPEINGHIGEANYRIAKTMFLMDVFPGVKQIDKKLNLRFEAMTGLNTDTAEQLQLNNYGLGGQYEFHTDHGEEGSVIADHPNGNRIATLLCYLSDVERGGETVFTKLGLSIRPEKGDAVFWFNLYSNGNGNPNTVHASCPVVSGSKWVANKWFHTYGNELRRKCPLVEKY